MAVKFKDTININSQYTLPQSDGAIGQAIVTDGAGNLSFSTVAAGTADSALKITLTVKNVSGGTLNAGTLVRVAPSANPPSGNVLEVDIADNSSTSTMSAVGILTASIANEAEGDAVAFGRASGFSTSGYTEGDPIWVGSNGAFIGTKPTGSDLIQKVGQIIKVHASNGSIEVFGAGRTNDVPNLSVGKIWVGTANNTAESTFIHLDETNNRLGVGTENPNAELEIHGNLNIGDGTSVTSIGLQRNSANYITATDAAGYLVFRTGGANNQMYIDTSGQVGIGKTPTEALDVLGNIKSSGNITGSSIIKSGGTSTQFLKADGSVDSNTYLTSVNDAIITIGAGTGLTGGGDFTTDQETDDTITINLANTTVTPGSYGDASNIPAITVDQQGRITSASEIAVSIPPGTTIGTVGNEISGTVTLEGSDGTTVTQSGSTITISSLSGNNALKSDAFTGTGSQTNFTLSQTTNVDTSFVFIQGVYQEKDTYSISGTTLTFNTAPSNGYSIEVISVGYVNVSGNNLDAVTTAGNTTANDITIGGLTVDTNTLHVDSTNNRVGIGTSNPSQKLHIEGNARITGTLDVSGTITATGGNSTQWNEAYSWGNPQALMSDISFGESYISNHRSRVLDNTGTYFPSTAGYDLGVLKNQGFMDKASLIFLPTGVKDGGLFSVKPKNVGDFDFTRATTATYVDEDGLIAIAPSNTPRLDYPIVNGVVQATPSLLLEPARTNLLPYSEDFSNAAWVKSDSTITSNSEISPDGTQNSYTLTTLVLGAAIQDSLSVSDGNVTFSVFVKKGTANGVRIRIDAATDSNAFFNLVTNTIYYSDDDAKIENYGNGWYRVSISANITSFVKAAIYTTDGTSSYDNGTLHIYGAQLEQGSYPTSYIPTSGSTVTRNADEANGAGDASTFNDSEGVLFAEISALADDSTFRVIAISDGSASNRVAIDYNTSNNLRGFYAIGGDTTGRNFDINYDVKQISKVCFKYKENDFAIWVNGFELGSSNSGSVLSGSNFNNLNFNFGGSSGGEFYGNTKQLMTFKEALTDTELENLTSWDSFIELAQGQKCIIY